jgi:hypothetical protein
VIQKESERDGFGCAAEGWGLLNDASVAYLQRAWLRSDSVALDEARRFAEAVTVARKSVHTLTVPPEHVPAGNSAGRPSMTTTLTRDPWHTPLHFFWH